MTPPISHVLQGLAHCFEKDDNGKLADSFVIEPISANSLEVREVDTLDIS